MESLRRIPTEDLKHQILALFTHELTHEFFGPDEAKPKKVQDFVSRYLLSDCKIKVEYRIAPIDPAADRANREINVYLKRWNFGRRNNIGPEVNYGTAATRNVENVHIFSHDPQYPKNSIVDLNDPSASIIRLETNNTDKEMIFDIPEDGISHLQFVIMDSRMNRVPLSVSWRGVGDTAVPADLFHFTSTGKLEGRDFEVEDVWVPAACFYSWKY